MRCKYYDSGCPWEGNLATVDDHLSKLCEFEIVSCKFESIGCNYKNKRKIIKHHEEREDKTHLQLALIAISRLTEENQTLGTEKSRVVEMKKYSRHKANQLEFHSDPFYTSVGGYRLELKVDANGSGHGLGTHVSVFINVLNSHHNHRLSWPFQGEVVVELLNQLEDGGHLRQVIAFEVANDVRPSIGRGFCQFILQSKLPHCHETNTQFLMDDSLYFRVSVKPKNYRPWLE